MTDVVKKSNRRKTIEPVLALPEKETEVKNMAREKKMKENIIIPSYDQYEIMKEGNNKYSLIQIKEICRFYKQKITGKKEQLAENLYNYLHKSKYAIIIQRVWRKYYIKVYNRLRGPARTNRAICVNETDFYTMEPLKDIPYLQFFSYCDDDIKKKNRVIYGFDILSLFMLLKDEYGQQDEERLRNPYTREPFPDNVKDNLFKLIRVSRRLGDKIMTRVEESKPSSPTTMTTTTGMTFNIRENIVLRTTNIFNDINDLGNYTLSSWFTNLGHPHLIRFIRELYDIWTYRANLNETIKREICPFTESLFRNVHINPQLLNTFPIENIRILALDIMEQLVKSGINRDSRYLGTNYVLCALTLVSAEAAEALPWLYQSVSYF